MYHDKANKSHVLIETFTKLIKDTLVRIAYLGDMSVFLLNFYKNAQSTVPGESNSYEVILPMLG